jgi:C4-dicarboxylate-specific signal transduction histidine kinase
LFGLASDVPLTRETFLAAVHPDDRVAAIAHLQDASNAGPSSVTDVRVVVPDDHVRWIRVRARSHSDERGAPNQLSGLFFDVTEQKAAELEAQRHRAELAHVARMSTLGELTASLAHELNQPLGAILSNAGAAQMFLAASPANVHEVGESLKDIAEAAQRAGEVIQRLRALVKKEQAAFAPLDVGDVVRDAVLIVHSDAILHKSRISVDVASGLPLAQGDRIQLQQVVLNLLVNAFDAMKDCPTNERTVAMGVKLDGAGMIHVSASDRGMGLGLDGIERIFQPFYTTKREGLGMGLSISRAIIEAHGGRLWAENNSDRGATLSFTLPAETVRSRAT